MAEGVKCPYYGGSGYCKISGCSQTQYQIDNYCYVEQGTGKDTNWKSCANYQGASEETRMKAR